jgi:hypothetical protein
VVLRQRATLLAIAAGLAVGGCVASDPSDTGGPVGGAREGSASAAPGGSGAGAAGSAQCPVAGGGQPWSDGPSTELVTLADGSDGLAVRAAVYPRPD